MPALIPPRPERNIVLSEAILNVQKAFGLSDQELGDILGLERSSIYRRKQAGALLKDGEKSWEFGVLLVRAYRSLFGLVGASPDNMRWWLDSNNTHLNGVPRELIKKTEGIVSVVQYLDAMRAKI